MFSVIFFEKAIVNLKKSIAPNVSKKLASAENKNKMPTKHTPNSTIESPNGNIRVYGPDGKAFEDIDYSHPHHHPELSNPHIHDWDWEKRPPRQQPRNPHNGELEAEKIIIAIGAGYMIYRSLRMLPSLLPQFWWTVPINFATP